MVVLHLVNSFANELLRESIRMFYNSTFKLPALRKKYGNFSCECFEVWGYYYIVFHLC